MRLVLGFLLSLSNPVVENSAHYHWPLLTVLTALLHQPQPLPFDFTHKFGGQGRSFSNTPYSANDLSFAGRRPQNNLTSGTSGVALPANPSLDYNGNSLLSDTP
jgi:hypothetical protein